MPQTSHKAVLLINLGSPDAPTADAIARYLGEFLSDRRVVDIPKAIWYPILHGIILRTRPKRLVAQYDMIWDRTVAAENGAPLKAITCAQAQALPNVLNQQPDSNIRVYWAMRYQNPSIGKVLAQMARDGVTEVAVLPLYPQYSLTTTETVFDEIKRQVHRQSLSMRLHPIREYHQNSNYIQALVQSIEQHWQTHGRPDFARGDKLLLSFHGLPERNVRLGDPYQAQCSATHQALAQALHLSVDNVLIAYQSRFGKQKWIQPYTMDVLTQLGQNHCQRVDVLCPGFAADCLETLEEVAHQLQSVFKQAGGAQYHYIPCLNTEHAHIEMMAQLSFDAFTQTDLL